MLRQNSNPTRIPRLSSMFSPTDTSALQLRILRLRLPIRWLRRLRRLRRIRRRLWRLRCWLLRPRVWSCHHCCSQQQEVESVHDQSAPAVMSSCKEPSGNRKQGGKRKRQRRNQDWSISYSMVPNMSFMEQLAFAMKQSARETSRQGLRKSTASHDKPASPSVRSAGDVQDNIPKLALAPACM